MINARIGIDFDNTIVSYDDVFHKVAVEKGLIPTTLPANKNAIRDYLRISGMERHWTALQGYVYGERMVEAPAFPGAIEFIAKLVFAGIPVFIISHKTQYPYVGPPYDLHQAALSWMKRQGIFDPKKTGMMPFQVFFELTKYAKLKRIAALKCTHFIDDLPELLSDADFPNEVVRFLFDPAEEHPDSSFFVRVKSWPCLWNKLIAA